MRREGLNLVKGDAAARPNLPALSRGLEVETEEGTASIEEPILGREVKDDLKTVNGKERSTRSLRTLFLREGARRWGR